MKTERLITRLLLTLPLTLISLSLFAQGKVAFVNDTAHLFVLDSVWVDTPDLPVAGQPIAGLYAGTSSSSLTLQSTTTPLTGTGLPLPGRMAQRSTLLNIPGGIPQWFRIMIRDSGWAGPLNGFYNGYYFGDSGLFQATPGTSISYPSIMPGSSANSTLGPGNIVVVCICPEPSSFALAALGALGIYLHRGSWR